MHVLVLLNRIQSIGIKIIILYRTTISNLYDVIY